VRVCITGALGFIGSRLAEWYRDQGAEVVGIDASVAAAGDEVFPGDVSEPGEWQGAVAGCDLVAHTAAIVDNTSPPGRCWAVNVLGVRRVLDAAVAAGVPRFVHLSSVRAFSDADFPDGVDETWPVRPDGHRYVDTKVASEQVVLQAHAAGEIAATIVRPGDVYGPGSVPWTIWPVLGLQSGTFALPAEGGVFSPVYIDDLLAGIGAAAGRAGEGQVFTIGGSAGCANEDFFGRYASMLGVELPIAPADEVRALFESAGVGGETVDYLLRRGTYSIAKARRVLGYQPTVDLDDGMARAERWLRSSGLIPS
jgi:nucleoside-diphosphate-sugar epimerase